MSDTEARLEAIRGGVPARHHNARTIAALASNPGCARRAVMDAAGVDKQRLASHVGFPPRFGQSRFAIGRGNAFEAQVKANGCAELLRLLRERLGLPVPEASYADLEPAGTGASPRLRHARTRELLRRAAAAGDGGDDAAAAGVGGGDSGGDSDSGDGSDGDGDGDGTLFDHPLLRLDVGGQPVYLEPDLIAMKLRGQFHIIEIKSFPIIDGQADGEKVAAAATQAAVYLLALRDLLAEWGYPAEMVAHDVVLVCPENFTNRPTATLVDVRKRLSVLRRQLRRLDRIDTLVDALPPDLTFDLALDGDGVPRRPAGELIDAIGTVPARYAPECLATCELAFFCRRESRGGTAALGRPVREDLGGVEQVATVLALADGALDPPPDQAEAARVLRVAAALRAECLPPGAGPVAAR